MFSHYHRWGFLVPLSLIASAAGVIVAVDLTIGEEAAKYHRWPEVSIFAMSGTICWLLGQKFKTVEKQVTVNPERNWKWTYERTNTFFFLSFKAWTLIFYGFMLYHLFRPMK